VRVGTEKSMNNTKKLRSALLSSLTIIASIVLGHTAQAAVLFFEPAGTQLDDDDILDIDVTGKKEIDFKIFINTAGLLDNIGTFSYIIRFDPKELAFRNIGPGQGPNAADVSDKKTLSGPNDVITMLGVSGINLNIPLANMGKHITTITFDIVKPGLKPDDGLFDFKISTALGTYIPSVEDTPGEDIPFDIFAYGPKKDLFFQEVEVQTPEPTSILGLFSLGIIGVGATIKRQVKRNYSIEKETTEIG